MVITGDLTQVDLPSNQESGLREAKEYLEQLKAFIFMSLIMVMWSGIR